MEQLLHTEYKHSQIKFHIYQYHNLQEQWKSNTSVSKRKERSHIDDDEGGHGERGRRKGGKRRRKEKKSRYEAEEAEAHMSDDREDMEDDTTNMNYREPSSQMNDQDDNGEQTAQDLLAAAGLEDSDADDDVVSIFPLFDT